MQIGIQFHFPPLSAQHFPPSNFIWNAASFERHFPRYNRESPAHIEPFWPPAPPGTVGATWTPELHLTYPIKGVLMSESPDQSPQGKCSEHRAPSFCMSGLSEQGLPLDIYHSPNFRGSDSIRRSGGSRDPPVPRESPAQNNEGSACSEQGPNPKGYANETPLMRPLLFKCLIYITIGGFRHRQVPREFPAQNKKGVLF